VRTTNPKAKYAIYCNLERLNRLSRKEAEAVFLDCSGSQKWAERMAAARPFPMVEHLFSAAERHLRELDEMELRAAIQKDSQGAKLRHFANSATRSIFLVDSSRPGGSSGIRRSPDRASASVDPQGSAIDLLQIEVEKKLSSLLEK
jgi:hypothetical protein